MTAITSNQSGNWGATATWVGGAVPIDGDSVTIATGHEVVFVSSDGTTAIDQSAWAGLAGLTITGTLKFPTNANFTSYLKMANNINIGGMGAIYVGNSSADPIPATSTATICLQGTGCIGYTSNTPSLSCYGAMPSINATTLAQPVALNGTTLVLTDDLGFKPAGGDQFVVSSGEETGGIAEANKGLYTIASYDAGTKTITIAAPGVLRARLSGDVLAWYNRPVNLIKPASNGNIHSTLNPYFEGTRFSLGVAYSAWSRYKFCTFAHTGGNAAGGSHGRFEDCTFHNSSSATTGFAARIIRGTIILLTGGNQGMAASCGIWIDCAITNSPRFVGDTLQQRIFNCMGKNNSGFLYYGICTRLYNCQTDTLACSGNNGISNPWYIHESFNHGNVAGAYRSWGCHFTGTVQSTTPYDGIDTLQFSMSTPTSIYPARAVRDYWFNIKAGKVLTVSAACRKDYSSATGAGLDIIDPNNDWALRDNSINYLVRALKSDNLNTWEVLTASYTAPQDMWVIVRVWAECGAGRNAFFYTGWIEKLYADTVARRPLYIL